ncbi:active breakpoint cluster region-related protein-like isoform X2 [Pristis pectinata]|uniref:active breakpoint cluster region-related protein-like isoform X1 n=1 Tax=Pristis pectinata TaxID=685728 RepID=UPI00223E5EBC|nr:active breakpoint cluster region-related protein-like isoform X1 [Pristis pectinata]XP_051900768.1 active breakpoint cluster region-related protein-like isoform X1 [Pristis pectinata]XP_051900769.1 active breakpoint cluster region-related protein-like isoform X2 [Pristis pectinata]
MDIYREACSYLESQGIPVVGVDDEDADDDQVFTQDPALDSVVRSHAGYPDRLSNSSGNFSPVSPATPDDPEKQLQRRKMVLCKVLENERVYITELDSLLLPMRPLKAAVYTSQPVLTNQEIQTIFFKVPELNELHKDFFGKLQARLEGGDTLQSVGDIFQQLVSQFGVYRAFVSNYPTAVETAEKCAQSKEQFKMIAQEMRLKPSKESKETPVTTTLEALLLKPVNHITRVTLLIGELLRNTPSDHTDYPALEKALNDSNSFLSATKQTIDHKTGFRESTTDEDQSLVKDGFVVEVSEGSRKLRHILLSTGLLFCTKMKRLPGRQAVSKCDWYLPLEDITLQSPSEIQLMAPSALQAVAQKDIEEAKARLMATKIEIHLEKKHNKGIERLRRKLSDIETWLLLNSPSLPLGLQSRNGKSFIFLFSSDYELHDWRETIEQQKKKGLQPFSWSHHGVQSLFHLCYEQRTARQQPLHSNAEESDGSTLRGRLTIKIHSVSGFKEPLNVYCCLEADCHGYFEKKVQTSVLIHCKNPQWEEEIDVELDGAQFLRILLWEQHNYRNTTENGQGYGTDRLIAKAQIWLDPKSLQSKEWKGSLIGMKGHQLSCSMKYQHQSLSELDQLTGAPQGTFGIPISIVTYREHSKIPQIVRRCVEEVERRGMKELGIYRVSGVATELQALKAAFDTNSKDTAVLLKDSDIHVVAGTLKLYLRSLPEPLLTAELVPLFFRNAGLEDSEAKDSQMTSLLHQLPQPNFNTLLYLLHHLKRVAQHEALNKMTLHNLATVFGPSLLRSENKGVSMDISHEVVVQVQVIFHFLSKDGLPLLEQREALDSESTET